MEWQLWHLRNNAAAAAATACDAPYVHSFVGTYALQNQFDSIDLSDNAIVRLEGFPRLPRLKILYLNNNRVTKIARSLQGAVNVPAQ